MSSLLDLFSLNILPIFLTAGAGFLLGKLIPVDPRTISRLTFYVFSPCLVFKLLTENQLGNSEVLRMAAFAALMTAIIAGLTWVVGRALKFERRLLTVVLLTTVFVNSGNYGLSVNSFAFGEGGLAYASLYFVSMGILTYTLGVVIASMGSASLKESLLGLFRYPIIYALGLAFVFGKMGWELPISLDRSVTLLSEATIPTMIVLLGLQLQRAEWTNHSLALVVANGMRLLAAPVIAIFLSLALGLQGLARQAGVMEASMPSAVMTIVLATEFEVVPAFVTTSVTVSTLLSPFVLTPLLAYLGG